MGRRLAMENCSAIGLNQPNLAVVDYHEMGMMTTCSASSKTTTMIELCVLYPPFGAILVTLWDEFKSFEMPPPRIQILAELVFFVLFLCPHLFRRTVPNETPLRIRACLNDQDDDETADSRCDRIWQWRHNLRA